MKNGPTKPPRLPIELMTAIETDADSRDRNRVGNAQNGDLNAYRPARARLIIAIAATGSATSPVASIAHAATPSVSAACRRRSARRSERRDQAIMTIVANRYGITAISPISVCVSLDENDLIICGIQ